jgi:hypothetical protein
MPIGELPITAETKTTIEVQTSSGEHIKFDRKTGLQVNAKNPRFANKIEVAG